MFKHFLNELRHRRVLRTTVAYAIVAAALVEFTDIITPVLDLPEGLLRGVIIISLVGFPLIMVLAWFFDLTPGGVVLGTPSPETSSSRRTPVISFMLIGLLGIAVAYLGYRLYWENQDQAGFATTAGQLIERAQAQGWGGSQLDYALASVAASTDSSAQALDHLRNAIDAGWDDVVFADHDPVMVDIVRLPEYRALLD